MTPRDYMRAILDNTPDLRLGARALLLLYADTVNRDGIAYPSVGLCARRLGMSPGAVRRCRAELVAAGVIAVQYRGRRASIVRFPLGGPPLAAVAAVPA